MEKTTCEINLVLPKADPIQCHDFPVDGCDEIVDAVAGYVCQRGGVQHALVSSLVHGVGLGEKQRVNALH